MTRTTRSSQSATKPPTLADLLLQITELSATVADLTAKVSSLSESNALLSKQMAELMVARSSHHIGAQVTIPDSYMAPDTLAVQCAYKVAAEREALEEKARNLVIVRLPEEPSVEDTAAKDDLFVSSLIRELGDGELMDAFASGAITHRRHPRERPANTTHSRIIKVSCPTSSIRNKLLSLVRRGPRPSTLRPYKGLYLRRDLTRSELDIEREVKRVAWQRNQDAGALVWGVRDINLYKYAKPFPLPANNAAH